MKVTKPILAGGGAAILITAAGFLFPPLDHMGSPERLGETEFARATDAFADALAGSSGGLDELEQFGLRTRSVEGANDSLLFSDTERDCSGRGIYWIRQSSANALAITAPHRGSDRHTGTLAAALYLEADASAAAWNSAPRRGDDKCDGAVDLARTEDHLFSAFALGFARKFPTGLIVQLHGFDGARRENLAAQDAAMILSDGTDNPGERLLDLADELSIAFAPLVVLVYPIGTRELGGTRNAQGRLLRVAGFDGFVHLELSSRLRGALVEDAELRRKLAEALARAAK